MTIDIEQIIDNIKKLDKFLKKHGKTSWSLVVKVLGGHYKVLESLLVPEVLSRVDSIADSRLHSLKKIKEIDPDIRTMYIAPAPVDAAREVVKVADVSLNTSYEAIEALNKEAKKQNKMHDIIVMIEMGELREGILRENIVDFYSKIFKMENINVLGLGTNLGCMHGVLPNRDKLIQLCLYKQIIEMKFDTTLSLISGGSSISLPLLEQGKFPTCVNHLRIGEAAFLGTSPFDNKQFDGLNTDAFEFNASVLELEKKEPVPEGIISEGNIGHTVPISEEDNDIDKEYRAVVDYGLVDVEAKDLEPKDQNLQLAGTTSDMTVYRITEKNAYSVGDLISFSLNYTAVARIMNSKFILTRVK